MIEYCIKEQFEASSKVSPPINNSPSGVWTYDDYNVVKEDQARDISIKIWVELTKGAVTEMRIKFLGQMFRKKYSQFTYVYVTYYLKESPKFVFAMSNYFSDYELIRMMNDLKVPVTW